MIDRLLDGVAGLAGPPLYLLAAALAFSETAVFLDLLIPGEVGMVVVGAAGHRAGSPLPLLVAAGTIGATLGDSVSYLIGRRFGLRLIGRWDITRRRLLPAAQRAEDYFERRGGWAVFAGRFVGALRAVVPVVAGTGHMPYPRFLAWNLAASATWAGAVITAGYYLGRHVAGAVERAGTVVSVVVVAVVVVAWLMVRRRRSGSA